MNLTVSLAVAARKPIVPVDERPQQQSFHVSDVCRSTWFLHVHWVRRDVQPVERFDHFVLAELGSKRPAARMAELLEECGAIELIPAFRECLVARLTDVDYFGIATIDNGRCAKLKLSKQVHARLIAVSDRLAVTPWNPRANRYRVHPRSRNQREGKIKTTPTDAGVVVEVQV